MWTEKRYTIKLDFIDKLVIKTLEIYPNVVFSGGWTRDKILHHQTTDIDLVAGHGVFQDLMEHFARDLNEIARKQGVILSELKKKVRKNLPFTPCHLSFKLKAKLMKDDKQPFVNLKIDIKQLPKGITKLTGEYALRDYTVNCLFYDAKKNIFMGHPQDFKDINNKLLYPCFDLEKRIDLIRLLRGIRIRNSRSLTLSEDLRTAMLSSKNVLNFHGMGTRKTGHTFERSPREYIKMLRDPRARLSHFTDLYFYGYIFKWPFYLNWKESCKFQELLQRHLNRHLNVASKWKGWKSPIFRECSKSYKSTVLPSALLMVVAIVSTVMHMPDFYCQASFIPEEVWESFMPCEQKNYIYDVFTMLDEDLKSGDTELKQVIQFGSIFYSQGFKPVPIEVEEEEDSN